MKKLNLIKSQMLRRLVKGHVKCRNYQVSMLCSADDEISRPTDSLINISLESIKLAQQVNLEDISARIKDTPLFPNIFPGEHYKLLAGLILYLEPKVVVEIGTAQGLSSLSIKKYLPTSSKLVTFDIQSWKDFSNTYLLESDFNEHFIQYTDDLSDYSNVTKHKDVLESADLIFIDAGKDGVMEYKFMENFKKINLKKDVLLIFDDIKLWNMLNFWRNIEYPKLDLTSFGHWTGTGIVQWRTNDTKTI